MNIYLVTQEENDDWDTYDSFICAAKSARDARKTHPGNGGWSRGTWCTSPDKAKSVLIGKAVKDTEAGVILSSFNAG